MHYMFFFKNIFSPKFVLFISRAPTSKLVLGHKIFFVCLDRPCLLAFYRNLLALPRTRYNLIACSLLLSSWAIQLHNLMKAPWPFHSYRACVPKVTMCRRTFLLGSTTTWTYEKQSWVIESYVNTDSMEVVTSEYHPKSNHLHKSKSRQTRSFWQF